MKLFRPRFSLKWLFAAMTLAAIGFVFVLPTIRAERFARFVRQHEVERANAMLPASIEDMSMWRQNLGHGVATIQPLTFYDLFHGQRRVIVGKGWGGGDAEFIVTRSSVVTGANWFHYL